MNKTLVAITFTVAAFPAFAQTAASGSIREIATGWNVDQFRVVTTEMVKNPANCPSPDGYISIGGQPGYNSYYAAALTAFLGSKTVNVTIDDKNCAAGRPKLIGINILK